MLARAMTESIPASTPTPKSPRRLGESELRPLRGSREHLLHPDRLGPDDGGGVDLHERAPGEELGKDAPHALGLGGVPGAYRDEQALGRSRLLEAYSGGYEAAFYSSESAVRLRAAG